MGEPSYKLGREMKYEIMAQIFANLCSKSIQVELNDYEQVFYNQLCLVLKQRARLEELLLYKTLKEAQDVIWPDQDEGGTPLQDFDSEEHRGDGEPPEV